MYVNEILKLSTVHYFIYCYMTLPKPNERWGYRLQVSFTVQQLHSTISSAGC